MEDNNIKDESQLEEKIVTANVSINADTGEHMILDTNDSFEDHSFDSLVEKINNGDFLDNKPLNEEEILKMLENSNDNSILNFMGNGSGMSSEEIKQLLSVINRRINGESFNVYKELPESAKIAVNNMGFGVENPGIKDANNNQIKNIIAENMIDEFISNVQINRSKYDFATELEKIYNGANKEIANASLEYIEDRNKVYRESLDNIEDEEKRNKVKAILDRIDQARTLDELKEFAKTCKIKCIELEKANSRVFSSFLAKYKNSSNNIYDINMAGKVLYRHMSKEYGYKEKHIVAFLVLFCKYVTNMNVNDHEDHAFMYYVLYYCAILDADNSKVFKDNVAEVIENIRKRNSYIG